MNKNIFYKIKGLGLFFVILGGLLSAGQTCAGESYTGKINAVKDIPGEHLQIELNDTWYTLLRTSDLYTCGKKQGKLNLNNLNDFIGLTGSVTPSDLDISSVLYILCD